MSNCPKCSSTNIKNNGKSKAGTQRYVCKDCGKTWSDNPKLGRPIKGKKRMTDAERAKNYRERKKNRENS